MSTKSSIKYSEDRFHLYQEMRDNDAVYLELTGCQFECGTLTYVDGRPCATVRIPNDIAAELGLILPVQP